MINMKRLSNDLLEVGEIGRKTRKGITRTAFSDEYQKASVQLIKLMEKAGLEVNIDTIGNIYGRREGKEKTLPAIMVGSHLDTVINGGLFDGALGIISALECIRLMNENNYYNIHPIELAAFNAEEGSDLGGTFGSRAILGLIDLKDSKLLEKAKTYNISKKHLLDSVRVKSDIEAFIELHIEQGGKLDNKNIPIGVVEGIAGITRYKVSVIGETNHAGTTPMELRRDAMIGASRLILDIEKIAKDIGDPLVATVGVFKIYPGAVNVIPGIAEFIVEIRDLDQSIIDEAVERIKSSSKKIKGFDFTFEKLVKKIPIKLDDSIVDMIMDCCKKLNIDHIKMPSGAGHDAKEFAAHVPTGMIFVRSKDGKSHCPEEYTADDDIEIGTRLLYETLVCLDKRQS